jgi:hypothetical protein
MNSKWTSTVSHQRLCIVVRSREIILEKQIAQWIWTYFVFFSCRCLVYTNNCFTMCKLILLSYAVRITTVISLIYHLQMNMKASRHFHQQHIIIGIILFCVSSFSRLCRQLDLLSFLFFFLRHFVSFPSAFECDVLPLEQSVVVLVFASIELKIENTMCFVVYVDNILDITIAIETRTTSLSSDIVIRRQSIYNLSLET